MGNKLELCDEDATITLVKEWDYSGDGKIINEIVEGLFSLVGEEVEQILIVW